MGEEDDWLRALIFFFESDEQEDEFRRGKAKLYGCPNAEVRNRALEIKPDYEKAKKGLEMAMAKQKEKAT